jgi:hypothetical protein
MVDLAALNMLQNSPSVWMRLGVWDSTLSMTPSRSLRLMRSMVCLQYPNVRIVFSIIICFCWVFQHFRGSFGIEQIFNNKESDQGV